VRIFYQDVFSSDLGANREALLSIFRFAGLDMPQSGNVDKLLDPNQTRVTSCAV
jgi:hypothetical protein